MVDVIIIGGGPAGMTAGLYARRFGLSALLVEHELIGGQASTTDVLANYPGFPGGIGGPELMMRFQEQAAMEGLEEAYEDVVSLDLSGEVKRVATSVRALEARSVILAMGANRRRLGLPNEEALTGRGISYCATCDGAFYRGKTVAVVGGGNTAAEDALYLARSSDVLMIHRRDSLRAQAHHVRMLEENAQVDMIWNTVVTAAEKTGDGVELTLRDVNSGAEEKRAVACLFVAVGTIPNTRLLKGMLELDEEGYVLAGEDTRTAIPLVYAAGDLRKKALKQVVTAVADGAVAASMAAQDLLT